MSLFAPRRRSAGRHSNSASRLVALWVTLLVLAGLPLAACALVSREDLALILSRDASYLAPPSPAGTPEELAFEGDLPEGLAARHARGAPRLVFALFDMNHWPNTLVRSMQALAALAERQGETCTAAGQ